MTGSVTTDICRESGKPIGFSLAPDRDDPAVAAAACGDLDRIGTRHLRLPLAHRQWTHGDIRAGICSLLATPSPPELLPAVAPDPADPSALDGLLGDGAFSWVELRPDRHGSARERAARLCDAARRARGHGRRVVIGGVRAADPGWLEVLAGAGVLAECDAVGLEAFPGIEEGWNGWATPVGQAREILGRHGSGAALWITAAGFSTWRHDQRGQMQAFLDAVEAPVARVYWHTLYDSAADDGSDPRRQHLGLRHADGTPKLLHRLLCEGGLTQVRHMLHAGRPPVPVTPVRERTAVITGGAGFIGSNVADRLAAGGRRVVVLDNLSRPGTEANLRWLVDRHRDRITFHLGDVRDRGALREALADAGEVYHFAAQVAVTSSLADPLFDFEANGRGTLNLLEEVRRLDTPPSLLLTSTNKVYGDLEDVPLRVRADRYEPEDAILRQRGIDESRPLEFCSPYGCSKGAADQYVLDHARSFGLPAAVFRMSCIYGPRQFGTEDQGWVAHFLIKALKGEPITIYGDGHQVRDVLFVDDLVDAMQAAQAAMPAIAGQAFNIGGGADNVLSLRDLLARMAARQGRDVEVSFADWRASDQRYYCSDTSRFRRATGWAPRVSVDEGIDRLWQWLAGQHGVQAPPAARAAL